MIAKTMRFWKSLNPVQQVIIYTVYATLEMTYGPVTFEQREMSIENLIDRSVSINHFVFDRLNVGLFQSIDDALTENPKAKFEDVVRSLIPNSNVISN